MRGGRRKNAGRKLGSGDAGLRLVRDALSQKKDTLLRTAIALATGDKPNVPVLICLLNKLLPSLHSSDVSGSLMMQRPFDDVPKEDIENVMKLWEEEVIEKYRKATEAGFETKTEAYMKRIGAKVIDPAPQMLPDASKN